MKNISLLFKPASSLCNMKCLYCFYNDLNLGRASPSGSIMKAEILDKILDNIFCNIDGGDRINIIFQGGEPCMAGLNWYERFVEKVKSRKGNSTVTYSFQTNGILLDESWCNFFIENNFLLGLSIDADRKIHDSKRQTLSGEGSFDACMKAKELLDKAGVDYNILSVLTNEQVWITIS